jgi:hypothetical protein
MVVRQRRVVAISGIELMLTKTLGDAQSSHHTPLAVKREAVWPADGANLFQICKRRPWPRFGS